MTVTVLVFEKITIYPYGEVQPSRKSNRDSVRKAREAYLIERGQTLEPHGLNKKDET